MAVATPAKCIHRFRFSEPAGPYCAAICGLCGEQRQYRTAEPDPTAFGRKRDIVLGGGE